MRFFQDGVLVATDTSVTYTMTNASNVLLGIGAQSNGTRFVNGCIDEVKIIKGFAKWTSNFLPSVKAY